MLLESLDKICCLEYNSGAIEIIFGAYAVSGRVGGASAYQIQRASFPQHVLLAFPFLVGIFLSPQCLGHAPNQVTCSLKGR